MIVKILKQFAYVITVVLYISFSLVIGTIWVLLYLALMGINVVLLIPVEYAITGNVKLPNMIFNYFLYDVPCMYNKMIYDFFISIDPNISA